MSDQGALGKIMLNDQQYLIVINFTITLELIMTGHNYTDTAVKTAAAAVNAGTCLEDGNSQDNIMSNVGSAVKAVSNSNHLTPTIVV